MAIGTILPKELKLVGAVFVDKTAKKATTRRKKK